MTVTIKYMYIKYQCIIFIQFYATEQNITLSNYPNVYSPSKLLLSSEHVIRAQQGADQ